MEQILERIASALERIEFDLDGIESTVFANKSDKISTLAKKYADRIVASDLDGIVLREEFEEFARELLS